MNSMASKRPIKNLKSKIPSMDLLSLILTLKPLAPSPAPNWWGRAAQVLLLQVVAASSPELAAQLHDEQALHPYTVSTLMGRFPGKSLDVNERYRLRITGLTAPICAILTQSTQPGGPLAPGATIELDYKPFQIESDDDSSSLIPHPSSFPSSLIPHPSSLDYSSLSASYLLTPQPPDRHVTLELTSPTLFKTKERFFPLPLPELVFGSLLARWNAYAPIAFPPELGRYASECLAVGRFELSSRAAALSESGARYGAVGKISYTALNYDRYWMSLVHTLAAYALYAGVGKGTAMGLGQCRKIEE
jgi:CRISPR-associated endoribonuclease Cas6